jgi:hypothetical protein
MDGNRPKLAATGKEDQKKKKEQMTTGFMLLRAAENSHQHHLNDQADRYFLRLAKAYAKDELPEPIPLEGRRRHRQLRNQ